LRSGPKVGVFGWYMHGNFGDEIMAVMIARTLKLHGFHPVLYKAPHRLALAEAVDTVETIDALTNGAVACVLGGGGLLVSAAENMTADIARFDEDVRQLAAACRSHSIPVWGVSIGGTGTGRSAKLFPGMARLLGSGVVRGVTTRLEGDRPLVEAFDIPAEHYPDIVFLSPDFWPAPPAAQRTIVVTNKIKRYWYGRRLIHALDAFGPGLCGVEPRHVSTRHVEFCPDARRYVVGRQDRYVPYTGIQELGTLLSGARAIVSSKLHLGIFGMAYGAAFFSYGGKDKTRAQLGELGLESHVLTTGHLPRWMLRLRAGCAEELETTARIVPDLRARAGTHHTRLLSFLREETGQGAAVA
jgi:hypothetical protein